MDEPHMNDYGYGCRHELKVARSLRCRGTKVSISPGSRGAADLTAKFPSGKSWKIQVKSSRGTCASSPCKKDLSRLKISASRSKSTPVIAKSTRGGITYTSARNGRRLKP